jgi:acetyl-CoA carboxylase biotin carboxyl carrier protein
MELNDEDVQEILALLDSLPYDELDLETPRFRLTLRRGPDGGWARSSQVLSAPNVLPAASGPPARAPENFAPTETIASKRNIYERPANIASEGNICGRLVEVRAPLPGTFYRAPRPGAAPFVEVGSRVGEDTVVAIIETMKLMNSVAAGVSGTVAEICLANADFTAQDSTLMRVAAER